ncbi:MAG: patatin family protein [Rikenellaceae bacterium]
MTKRALILEGGGMRGAFTAGVLDNFLDNNIEFDYVVGVSAGCSNALSHLAAQRGRSLYIHTTLQEEHPYIGLRPFIKTGELIDLDFLFNELLISIYPFDFDTFAENKAKFEIVATNALTGEACYLSKPRSVEELKLACRASSSLPFINRAITIDGTPYVDGGVSDSIPLKRAYSQGYNNAVVVSTQCEGFRKRVDKRKIPHFLLRKYPKVVDMLNSRAVRYNQDMEWIERLESEGKVTVIRPTPPLTVSRLCRDTKQLKALYDQGYSTAEEMLSKLKTPSE